MANHADEERVLAATHAEGHTTKHPREEEEGEAPEIGHVAGHLLGETLGLAHAGKTHDTTAGTEALVAGLPSLVGRRRAVGYLVGVAHY